MLQLTAKLMNVYKTNNYTDYETGKVTPGKVKLQLLQVVKMKNGSDKHELIDLTVPDSKEAEYRSKIGKEVTVQVGIMAKSYKFYGL
ncbi:MAG: hypothetical protein ACQESN_11230 [Thermotogota bacterium]